MKWLQKADAWLASLPKAVKIAAVVGLALRTAGLAWVYASGHADGLVYGDGLVYVELARNLLDGHGFALFREGQWMTETFRTPGLSVLLIPFVRLAGGLTLFQFLLAAVSGVGMPALGWAAGRRLFGDRAGKVTAWLCAVEPLLIFFSWFTLTEVPFLLLSLGAFVIGHDARQMRSWKRAAWSGVLAAAAVYIRPGNFVLFVFGYAFVIGYDLWLRRSSWKTLLVSLLLLVGLLVPWMARMQAATGVFTLSATGWRNVYTDYLASIRAVENHTTFWDEKAKLKDVTAQEEFGLTRWELNDPSNSTKLRNYALKEIVAHPTTVLKLQTLIFVSFFTNDSYASYLMRVGMLPNIQGRVSPTYAILTKGLAGVGDIVGEMKRQWFIPVLGRASSVGLIVLAGFGLWRRRRSPAAWWCVLLIGWTAVASSVIGLGVEARLRLSILPLIFILAAAALDRKRSV